MLENQPSWVYEYSQKHQRPSVVPAEEEGGQNKKVLLQNYKFNQNSLKNLYQMQKTDQVQMIQDNKDTLNTTPLVPLINSSLDTRMAKPNESKQMMMGKSQ